MTLPPPEVANIILAEKMEIGIGFNLFDLNKLQMVWRKLTKAEWDILDANLESYYDILSDESSRLAFCAPVEELAQLTADAIKAAGEGERRLQSQEKRLEAAIEKL